MDNENYDLSRAEWQRICGKKIVPYSDEEKQHILRFMREGVAERRVGFSLRMTTTSAYVMIDGLKRLYKCRGTQKWYTKHREQAYLATAQAMIRRKICLIARNLSPQERIEFAKHMGFKRRTSQHAERSSDERP